MSVDGRLLEKVPVVLGWMQVATSTCTDVNGHESKTVQKQSRAGSWAHWGKPSTLIVSPRWHRGVSVAATVRFPSLLWPHLGPAFQAHAIVASPIASSAPSVEVGAVASVGVPLARRRVGTACGATFMREPFAMTFPSQVLASRPQLFFAVSRHFGGLRGMLILVFFSCLHRQEYHRDACTLEYVRAYSEKHGLQQCSCREPAWHAGGCDVRGYVWLGIGGRHPAPRDEGRHGAPRCASRPWAVRSLVEALAPCRGDWQCRC